MTQTESIRKTIIKIELLAFFQANPHTRDTANGLATRLHRSPKSVKMACDALVSLGILYTNENSKNIIYRLNNGELINAYYQENDTQAIILHINKSEVQNDTNKDLDYVRG